MYSYEIKPSLQKVLNKLSRKNKSLYEQILKQIQEIINSESLEHYKNLKYNLKEFKRIHIGHFVLIFKCDEIKNLISFEDLDHHDNIYKKKVILN
jgi:YafQ family addiction module toxin component